MRLLLRAFPACEKAKDIVDGFVAKSKDWEEDSDWADLIIFDDTLGQGEKAKALREQGKKVIGGTPHTDRLEDDRSFGQEELKKAGVSIIPYTTSVILRPRFPRPKNLSQPLTSPRKIQPARRRRNRTPRPVRWVCVAFRSPAA